MQDSDDGDAPVPMAWFFMPLPEPIAVPHGMTIQMRSMPEVKDLIERGPAACINVSVRFSHSPLVDPPGAATLGAAFRCAESGFAKTRLAKIRLHLELAAQEVKATVDRLRGRAGCTTLVAEVAVPLPSDTWNQDEIRAAFRHAVAQVREIQLGYAAALQEPVRTLTAQLLPPVVPTFLGYTDGTSPTCVKKFAYPTESGTLMWHTTPEPLTEEELERFDIALSSVRPGGNAFSVYSELRNDAWVEFSRNGGLRHSAVAIAMAGEVFMDTMLLHLMWEEGMTPADAADIFGAPDIGVG